MSVGSGEDRAVPGGARARKSGVGPGDARGGDGVSAGGLGRHECYELAPDGDRAALSEMSSIPGCRFILTSAFEETRRGLCAAWVQQASTEPPTISVAIRKGHDAAPIIRDSRAFALCQLPRDDRFLWKKFSREDNLCDPFHSLEIDVGVTGSPLIRRARAAFECEVALHADWESDFELYIGRVVGVRRYLADAEPDFVIGDSLLSRVVSSEGARGKAGRSGRSAGE